MVTTPRSAAHNPVTLPRGRGEGLREPYYVAAPRTAGDFSAAGEGGSPRLQPARSSVGERRACFEGIARAPLYASTQRREVVSCSDSPSRSCSTLSSSALDSACSAQRSGRKSSGSSVPAPRCLTGPHATRSAITSDHVFGRSTIVQWLCARNRQQRSSSSLLSTLILPQACAPTTQHYNHTTNMSLYALPCSHLLCSIHERSSNARAC